jgi:hypothetical protein
MWWFRSPNVLDKKTGVAHVLLINVLDKKIGVANVLLINVLDKNLLDKLNPKP